MRSLLQVVTSGKGFLVDGEMERQRRCETSREVDHVVVRWGRRSFVGGTCFEYHCSMNTSHHDIYSQDTFSERKKASHSSASGVLKT